MDALPSWVISGLLGGLLASGLGLLPRRAKPDSYGWRRITPGISHWVGLVLACVLVTFLSIMAAREPMTTQDFQQDPGNTVAFYGVLLFFWAATVFMVMAVRRIRKANVRWLGGQIVFNLPDGKPRSCSMTDVAQICAMLSGHIEIVLFDGTVLKIDRYANGADELCDAIVSANDGDERGDDEGPSIP